MCNKLPDGGTTEVAVFSYGGGAFCMMHRSHAFASISLARNDSPVSAASVAFLSSALSSVWSELDYQHIF